MSDIDIERIRLKLVPEFELAKMCLNENKMSLLLQEKLEQSDIEDLRKALDDTESSLRSLDSSFGGAGIKLSSIPGVGDYADALAGAITKARGALTKLDLEDPKWHQQIRKQFGQGADAAGIARAAAAIQGRASEFHAALNVAIEKIAKGLEPVVSKIEGAMDTPIKDLAGQPGIPELDDLKKGIEDALEKGAPKKGAAAAVSKFFSGMFKRGDPILDDITGDLPDSLNLSSMAEFVLEQPLSSIKGVVAAAEEPPTPPADVIADVQDEDVEIEGEPPELSGDAGDSGEEAAADAEGSGEDNEEPSGDGYAITRQDLRSLKAAMDKAKQSKKSQSRALGAALNGLVGQKIFAESTLYTINEASLILASIPESSLKNTSGDENDRWLKMAGILK